MIEVVYRCYTISAAPTRPHAVSITVKRVPGGPVSNWLHDNLRPGMSLKVSGPMGEFTYYDHPADKYLFVSGGSGITPLMSMARTLHDLAGTSDVVFVHNARSPDDIIFRRELEGMARHRPGFRFVPVCEARFRQGVLGRLPGPGVAVDDRARRAGFPRARGLRVRALALHGRRSRHPRRGGLRHGPPP